MKKALIIKKYWLDQIFDNNKIWEMRSRPTAIRGKILLIAAGTGKIFGEVDLIDSYSIAIKPDDTFYALHKIRDVSLLAKWKYAWVLSNPIKYVTPIPYKHPRGAVTWVILR
jgi:hypothetical protein